MQRELMDETHDRDARERIARARARHIEVAARELLTDPNATRYTVARHAWDPLRQCGTELLDFAGDGSPLVSPGATRAHVPAEAHGVVIHEGHGRALLAFDVPGGPAFAWCDWSRMERVR